jgi:hypothetical protein
VRERERDKERDRDRERETKRDRETERERDHVAYREISNSNPIKKLMAQSLGSISRKSSNLVPYNNSAGRFSHMNVADFCWV